ncbi:MAG: M48 family metallopeptidase [Gemmobacter sp.]
MAGRVPSAYHDGLTARRHVVGVEVGQDGLVLHHADGRAEQWPFARLRRIAAHADGRTFTLALLSETGDELPRDPARLVVSDAGLAAEIRRAAPLLARRELPRGALRRVAIGTAGALGAVALILFVIVPMLAATIAERMPRETEIAFGESVVAQIKGFLAPDDAPRACEGAAGRAALGQMTARLTAARTLGYDLRIEVFDHQMVNAFAAPGGHIILMRGLIEAAETPEEVAGVLAHEIGHVEARDPTRLALRAAGSAGILSLLIGDMLGGAVIALAAEHMLSTAYTREAEVAADGYALALLAEAGVGAGGYAAFFDRVGQGGGMLPEYLATHPDVAGRAERARAAAAAGGAPILSAAEWAALRAICD